MRIVVLGGAGAMAQVIDRDLARSKPVDEVIVADRDAGRVKQVLQAISSEKLDGAEIDVTDSPALNRLVRGADAVINATWYQLNVQVMRACIEASVHYVDLGGLYRVTLEQLKFDGDAKDAGVTCLVGMGSTPGTMNVMAAHAASQMDTINRVNLRSAGAIPEMSSWTGFVPPYSIRTILDEFSLPVPVLRDGKIQEIPPASARVRFSMPEPVGEVGGLLTIHSELATLPHTLGKGVREMDFAVAFDPEFTRILETLVRLGLADREPMEFRGQKIVPYEFVAAVIDRLPKPSEEPPDVDIQRCEVLGSKGGEPARVVLDCISRPRKEWGVGGGTVGTGTPPSIAAQWLASGRIAEQGVVPPEVAVEPLPFFAELRADRRGIEVYEQIGGGPGRVLSG